MGCFFKWWVHLGDQYGPFVADGYVHANSVEDAEEKVAKYYNNAYHCVVIEENYNFFRDDDFNQELYDKAKECHKEQFNDGVIIRWEE